MEEPVVVAAAGRYVCGRCGGKKNGCPAVDLRAAHVLRGQQASSASRPAQGGEPRDRATPPPAAGRPKPLRRRPRQPLPSRASASRLTSRAALCYRRAELPES